MLRAIALAGKWMLRPYDRKNAEKCTSWFNEHEALEIDTQNSILTELLSAGVVEDDRRYSSDVEWVVSKEIDWVPEEGLHAIVKLPDARKIRVNGTELGDAEITGLLKEGKNLIEALVPGYFSCDMAYIYTSKTGIVQSAHIGSEKADGGFLVTLNIDYRCYAEHTEKIHMEMLDETLDEEISFRPGRESHEVSLFIPESKITRWEVNGDGKQNVYRTYITIGPVELERRLAFRDIRIDDGILYVNGNEFFAKGAVWPVGRFRDKIQIETLLTAAQNANMNLLYIEKGHEENFFYNTADRKGLLILHGEDCPALRYHPSFVSGGIEYDIFNCISHDSNYFEHILDAVALERFVLRTRSTNKTGVIYRNLLSTVTSDGTWKPSHYCTRRFFADLVPIMYIEDGKLRCFVSNDSDRTEDVEVSIKFLTYDGKKKGKKVFNKTVPAHTSMRITEQDISSFDTKREYALMKIATFSIHRELTLLLDNISSCDFALPEFTTSVRTISPRSFSIRLKASKPAFAIHFRMDGVDGSFSDSFFEVRPSDEKSVVFKASRDMTEEEVLERLEIFDLAHSLQKKKESEHQ